MFWKKRELTAAWRMTCDLPDEIIWKLLISPSGILTGEERDPNAKRGTMFAIEIASGRILWRHVHAIDDWWFNSEQATSDTLFMHGFRAPNHPEPLGIYALDLQNGRERWRQPELTMLVATDTDLFATKQTLTGRSYLILDATTGATREELSNSMPALPEPLLSNETRFASHANRNELAPLRIIDLDAVTGPIDSLESNDHLILAYHAAAATPNMLANELLVYDRKQRRVCYRETLHHETPLPLPENFFVSHGFLLYVKEKQTVVGVDLRRKF